MTEAKTDPFTSGFYGNGKYVGTGSTKVETAENKLQQEVARLHSRCRMFESQTVRLAGHNVSAMTNVVATALDSARPLEECDPYYLMEILQGLSESARVLRRENERLERVVAKLDNELIELRATGEG